jgi:hypothetical protein
MKTLPVVYGTGTSSRRYTSFSRHSVRSGSGTRQTKLAAAASPPRAPSLLLNLALVFIVFLIINAAVRKITPFAVSSLHGQALQIWSLINPFLSLALAGVLLVVGLLIYSSKRKTHAVRMTDWENTWMCLQCGGHWK